MPFLIATHFWVTAIAAIRDTVHVTECTKNFIYILNVTIAQFRLLNS